MGHEKTMKKLELLPSSDDNFWKFEFSSIKRFPPKSINFNIWLA